MLTIHVHCRLCVEIFTARCSLYSQRGIIILLQCLFICIHWSSFCGIFQAELGGSIVTTYITCLGGGEEEEGGAGIHSSLKIYFLVSLRMAGT